MEKRFHFILRAKDQSEKILRFHETRREVVQITAVS